MPRKEPLLGYFAGEGQGNRIRVAVYKAGRTYRLSYLAQTHLCHPSITSLALCKREASHVFMVDIEEFQPL